MNPPSFSGMRAAASATEIVVQAAREGIRRR